MLISRSVFKLRKVHSATKTGTSVKIKLAFCLLLNRYIIYLVLITILLNFNLCNLNHIMNNKGTNYYIEAGKRAAKWHSEQLSEMRKCKFDTIAVHGVYSLQEALDFNQGSTIEPIYMSASQAFRDSDEMEAALSYQTPGWVYSRIANPSMFYLEGVLAMI